MSFNKIAICGNLGRDPELRTTPKGDSVCSFSIATNEKKGIDDVTTWFRVTLWGKQAITANTYLTKGMGVYVEGRLRMETYTGKDGNPRTTLEVNATDMQFLPKSQGLSGDDSDVGMEREKGRDNPTAFDQSNPEDLPF